LGISNKEPESIGNHKWWMGNSSWSIVHSPWLMVRKSDKAYQVEVLSIKK